MLPMAICFALLASLASMCAEGFNLVVDKPYQQISPNQNFVVLCKSDVPLMACQIKVFNTGAFYELSKGKETPSTGGVSYSGTGLENGQCGLSFSNPIAANNYRIYVCRARAFDSSWNNGVSVVQVLGSTWSVLPVESGLPKVLADPGSNVTFQFVTKTREPLDRCLFKWPGQMSSWTSNGAGKTYSIDNDLGAGKCSLTMLNLNQGFFDESGFVQAALIVDNPLFKVTSIHVKTLMVKTSPTKPVLTLKNPTGVFKQGDVMEASCSVGAARPAARITWLLGDDVIRNDDVNDDDDLEWRFEFEDQSVTQTLNRTLSVEDSGKVLKCIAQHPALVGGREVKQIITVT